MLEVVEVELVPGLVVAGRWRLERAIGQGGFGVVWSAVDIQTGETRALKCLTKEGASDTKRQERLRREARAMSGIDHPHIARVFGLEELPAGTPFFVMELLRGRTLHSQLQRGPLSIPQARGILIQIADALRTVHARGIIHRDLKPANIIIIDDRYAKVLDFGISKDLSAGEVKQLTTTGTALGTLNYMAPEQIFGERNLDPRCDVWALGVIAHECLTLRRPTDGEGDNSGQVLKAILDGNFPRLSSKVRDCPKDIDDLVARMLLRDAKDRPTSEEVFMTLALPAISPTMRNSIRKTQFLETLPISDVPIFAQTFRDERFAASQLAPSHLGATASAAPTEIMASAMAPTVMPSTAMPATVMPSTAIPPTEVPSTRVPSTRVPSTEMPSTVVPPTMVASTPAPSTQVPSTVHVARPIAHAATMTSPQHAPSDGAIGVAPAVTPGNARPFEAPAPPATTVVVDAVRAREAQARARSLVIALAVFGAFVFVGIGIIVFTTYARRSETTAREAPSASVSAITVVSATPTPTTEASAIASASATTSASASAAAVGTPAETAPPASSTPPASASVATKPKSPVSAPAGRTPPKPTPAAHGDPPISNERF